MSCYFVLACGCAWKCQFFINQPTDPSDPSPLSRYPFVTIPLWWYWRAQSKTQSRFNCCHVCKMTNPPAMISSTHGRDVWKWRWKEDVVGHISFLVHCSESKAYLCCGAKFHFIIKANSNPSLLSCTLLVHCGIYLSAVLKWSAGKWSAFTDSKINQSVLSLTLRKDACHLISHLMGKIYFPQYVQLTSDVFWNQLDMITFPYFQTVLISCTHLNIVSCSFMLLYCIVFWDISL